MSRHAGERPETLARLYRFTLEGGANEATRALIKELLLAELGATPEELAPSKVASPAPASPGSGRAAATAAARPAARPAPAGPAPSRAAPESPEHLELRIRHLVEADAGWDRIEPLALGLFQLRRDSATAARVIELAFLHGSSAQLEGLIGEFKEQVPDFYRHMHAAVRAHLVVRIWRDGGGDGLATLLFRDRDEAYLQPIERLFLFHSMAGAKDQATPYIYFRRFRGDLLGAASELGAHVGLSLPAFLLIAGRMAVDLGYDNDGRDLLAQIPENEPERDEALQLLLTLDVERNKHGRSHYVELLMGQASPAERLAMVGRFFGATRGLGGFRDRNRPALNEILKEPLTLLTEEPELWSMLSELLVANRDLETLLPNLFAVFRAQAGRFHAPLLDAALWQGWVAAEADTARDWYWRGVALLHHYVDTGAVAEPALWEAKALVAKARRGWREPLPMSWRDLYKAAFTWVGKSHYLLEADRARMLRQLRIAVDFEMVATADLDDYVAHADAAPLTVLAELQAMADAKNAPALEAAVILRRAQRTHLTNRDLSRLWQLANDRKESDRAWRTATVLQARGALAAPARAAWEISGEKRASYSFQAPPKGVIDHCLAGFAPRAARLAHASLHVGPALPELLALLDPGAVATRIVPPPAASVDAKVERALAGLTWLAAPKRRYRFTFEAAMGGAQLPAFVQVLPANPWSLLVARLAERLGLNAWGWKLSRLGTQIVDLIPRLASRQDLRRHSGRVAKWLKELSPEQRAAWQDLATLSRGLEDDQAAEALAMFLARLATVILPNHLLALQSLQAMRAPAAVLWDLEAWILGDAYTAVRQGLGIQNRVLVPNALQRLETIVG